jgi:putative DNA primase/helicase
MKRPAKSAGIDIDELSTSVIERFDEVEWKDFNISEMARRNEARSAVIDIRQDLLKIAATDPTRAARIWDEHVPSFVPRPDELPAKAPETLDLNTIEPGRRRRRTSAEPFVEPSQALGGKASDQARAGAERVERVPPIQASTQREEDDPRAERMRLLMDGLNRQYLKSDDKYHFRDRTGEVAFEAQEKKLLTQHQAPAVVSSMIDLAEARGWSSLKLSGTEEFRREAWLQASVRGLETSGYRPDKLDKARLEELQKERTLAAPVNAIMENVPKAARSESWTSQFDQVAEDGKREQRIPLTQGQDQFLRAMEATMRHRGDAPKAIEKARALAVEKLTSERVHLGTLVEVGTAPYQDKRGEKPSHFVTLEDDKGQRSKIWGVDLPRALEASGAEPGQKVAVVYRGQKPVEVDVKVRNADGDILGTRRQTVERNTWEVVPFDRLRDEAKASVTKAIERQNNPAALKVFDRAAKPAAPTPEPQNPGRRERSRERIM